jgi:hypothetical protein
LYFDKHSLSFVMKLSIEQLGLAMETNPQHETGSWLHHGTRREHSEAEIPGDFPALASLFNSRNGAGFSGKHPDAPIL